MKMNCPKCGEVETPSEEHKHENKKVTGIKCGDCPTCGKHLRVICMDMSIKPK